MILLVISSKKACGHEISRTIDRIHILWGYTDSPWVVDVHYCEVVRRYVRFDNIKLLNIVNLHSGRSLIVILSKKNCGHEISRPICMIYVVLGYTDCPRAVDVHYCFC